MYTVTRIFNEAYKVRLVFPDTTGSEILTNLSQLLNSMALRRIEEGGDVDVKTGMLPIPRLNEETT